MAVSIRALRGMPRAKRRFLACAFLGISGWIHAATAVPPLHVIISVDTETSAGCGESGCFPMSIEDRILGLKDGQPYGITLMMDLLERHAMRATFFVNAYLDSAYPEAQVASIVRQIVERGHDVQFHAHEEFRCFEQCKRQDLQCWSTCTKHENFIGGNSYENQLAILKDGAARISKWSGQYPVAFRGGAYDADLVTLRVLRELHIPIDSSFSNPEHVLKQVFPVNRVAEYAGIVELPLITFRETLFTRQFDKRVDIEGLTLRELKKLVDVAAAADMRTFTLIMHSFSFCRIGDRCPIVQNVEKFARLLEFLDGRDDVRVITIQEFWKQYQQQPGDFIGSGHIPTNTYTDVLYRSFVRFGDGYKNKVFAIANILVLVVLIAVMVGLLRALWSRRSQRNGRTPSLL